HRGERVARIGISCLRLEVTCDAEFDDPVADLAHTGAVGLGIVLRLIDPARLDQMTIDERVLTGNLGGGAPGHLSSDAECLDDRNREASTCQQISRRETDNSSADHPTSAAPDPLSGG